MIRCNKCILPVNYPGIRFDRNGVCNYCKDYEILTPHTTLFLRPCGATMKPWAATGHKPQNPLIKDT